MDTRKNRDGRHALWMGAALVMVTQAAPVHAKDAAAGKDPGIVILRTVHPRTAYRQIPKEDMPVHTEATTFPLKTFGAHMDVLGAGEVGDAQLLGARGSAGVATGPAAAMTDFVQKTAPLDGAAATGSGGVPLGMGANLGTAVGGATAGIGGTVQNAMNGVLGALPATGGGGP